MQTISAVSSNVAVRGDSSPCSKGLWLGWKKHLRFTVYMFIEWSRMVTDFT